MIAIIVGPERHVWVGRVTREGNQVVIRESCIIRKWSTGEKGMASLADLGPAECVLERMCARPLRLHPMLCYAEYECNEKAWESVYGS